MKIKYGGKEVDDSLMIGNIVNFLKQLPNATIKQE